MAYSEIQNIQRYCVENHGNFGSLHFVTVAIGLNVAIKGAAFFREWISNVSQKMVRKRYAKFATALDKTDNQKPEEKVLKKNIEETIAGVHDFSQSLFRLFSVISWTLTIYGVFILYIDFPHCSNLLIILPWPIYVLIIWITTKLRCRNILKKLSNWQEINDTSKSVTEEIAELKSGLPKDGSDGSK